MNDLNKLFHAATRENSIMMLDSLDDYEECSAESLLEDLVSLAGRGKYPETVEFLQVLIQRRCSY